MNCPKCGSEVKGGSKDCPECGIIFSKFRPVPPKKHELEFTNYKKYERCTKTEDWKGICKINGVGFDTFGTKKELKVLPEYLEDGEVVLAFASGIMKQTQTSNAFDGGANTWIVVLTNERFLFLDHAMITKSVDTQSVRHDSVQAVSASQGLMMGKIQIDLGARVIVIDNCQKDTVKVIANLANKWLRFLKQKKLDDTKNTSPGSSKEMQELARLAQLQIQNQEKIISLLADIKKNDLAFYSRVARKQ